MPPRPYNNDARLQQQAELKARIAAAAAELHALQGAVATSYAEVARHAGVSLPTVYAHFPGLDDLVRACSAHVAAEAPPFPAEAIAAAPDLASAARALVDAADRANAYFEPWMTWREARHLPVLAERQAALRQQKMALIEGLLERHLGSREHRETAAIWETLLFFEPWQRLVRDHRMPRKEVRARLLQLLLAAAGSQAAAASPLPRPAPRRK